MTHVWIKPLTLNLLCVLGFIGLALPLPALADGYVSLVGLPGIDSPNNLDMQTYINTLYRMAIVAAALIAVIKLILAGAQYVLSGVVTSKEQAKKDIYAALVGLLIIIVAVVILTTINPKISNLPALQSTSDLIDDLGIPKKSKTSEEVRVDEMCAKENGGCTRFACSRFTDPTKRGWTFWLGLNGLDQLNTTLSCGLLCTLWYGGELTQNSSYCTYSNDPEKLYEGRVRTEQEILDQFDITKGAPIAFIRTPFESRQFEDDKNSHPNLIGLRNRDFVGYISTDWNSLKGREILSNYNNDKNLAIEAFEFEYLKPACGDYNQLIKVQNSLEKTGYYCVR